ncbi:MAG: hypothetical protein AB7W28_04665 [Armatimonadota bacterium]
MGWQRTERQLNAHPGVASPLGRHLAHCDAWWRAGLLAMVTMGTASTVVALLSIAAIAAQVRCLAAGQRSLVEALIFAPLVAALASTSLFALPWSRAPVAAVVQRLLARRDDELLTAAEALDGHAQVSPVFGPLLQLRATTLAQEVSPRQLFWAVPWRKPYLAAAVACGLFALSLLCPDGWARLGASRLSLTGLTQPVTTQPRPDTATPGPVLVEFSLAVEPPSYTGRPAQTLQTPAGLTVACGSRLRLQARFADCETTQLQWTGQSRTWPEAASFETVVVAPTIWSLSAKGPGGLTRLGPYRVDVVADRAPSARILQPSGDVTLLAPAPVLLALAADDDYGLRRLVLQWRTGSHGQWRETPVTTDPGRTYRGELSFDLRPMNLLPGDEVVLRLVAVDNNEVTGPRTTYSQVRVLRLAAHTREIRERPAQMLDEVASREEDAWQRLQRNLQELGEQIQQLERQLEDGRGADTGRRQAEMADVVQRLEKAASGVKQAMAAVERTMSLADLMDEEMLAKVAELHRLSQDLLDKNMKELLERLRDVMKVPDLNKLRADAQELRQMHERFLHQLDQTLDLLKRARMEMILEALQKKVSELADRQEQALNRTNTMREGDVQARREADTQANLARETQPLPEEMRLAAERTKDLDENTAQALQALADRVQREDPASNMRQATNALQRLSPGDARQAQRQALQSLRRAAGDLAGLQADATGRRRRELQTAASQAVAEAVGLAQAQQRLLHEAKPLAREVLPRAVQQKETLERLSARQQALADGAERLSQQLQTLAGKTPKVGPELSARMAHIGERMRQAARSLQGGEGMAAQMPQQQSLTELNRLAAELVALSQALGEESAQAALSEYLKRLEQLAEQQRALNQQSQQMGAGSPVLSELGLQQAMIKAALDKLMRGAGEQLSDKLGGASQDMQQVSNDLRERRLTEQTKTRQRNILHKMLDAQRSLYTREQQSRERVAERPKPFKPAPSPPAISSTGPSALALPKLEQSSSTLVPPEYSDLAEAYLRQIRGHAR